MSAWHVRNLLRESGKELKEVSGAKSFTSFLRDILKGKNKEEAYEVEELEFVSPYCISETKIWQSCRVRSTAFPTFST